jgi:hypothetical protein
MWRIEAKDEAGSRAAPTAASRYAEINVRKLCQRPLACNPELIDEIL